MKNKLQTIKILGWIATIAYTVATGGIPSPGLLLGLAIIVLSYGEQTPTKRRIKGWCKTLKLLTLM